MTPYSCPSEIIHKKLTSKSALEEVRKLLASSHTAMAGPWVSKVPGVEGTDWQSQPSLPRQATVCAKATAAPRQRPPHH